MKTIHKSAAIAIEDNKFLVVRKKGKHIWTSLGGRVEPGETEQQCLLREIKEEINCSADIIKKLGDFEDKAVFDDATIRVSAFLVQLKGQPNLIDPELEDYRWINKDYKQENIKLGSILEKHVIPYLIEYKLLNW